MKKYFVIMSYALLNIACTSIFSMQQPAARTVGERFIKPFISKTATAAHWGISYGPFLGKGLGSLFLGIYDEKAVGWTDSMDNKILPKVDPVTEKFIEEQAQKVGLKNTPSARIVPISFSPAGAFGHVVMLDKQFASALKEGIHAGDKKIIVTGAGLLQHEANHIKNKDILMRGIAFLTIPLLNHRLIKIGKNALPFIQKTKSFWPMQAAKVSSGVGKYIVNDVVCKAVVRAQEQRADNGICDDIETLDGFKNFFIRAAKAENEFIHNTNDRSPRILMKKHFPLIAPLFENHPSFDKRVAKLDERIKYLENKA